MLKRRLIWWPIAGVMLFGMLAVILLDREREPEYGGKKLSEWAESPSLLFPGSESPPQPVRLGDSIYFFGGPRSPNSYIEAVRQMGTNALPYLLRWLRYESPAWKSNAIQVINRTFHAKLSDRKARRSNNAVTSLIALGTNAEGAVPSLTRLMNEAKTPTGSRRARNVLSSLTSYSLSANLVIFANEPASNRLYRVQQIGKFASSPGFRSALPLLLHLLQDEDIEIAEEAAKTLGRARMEPSIVVPALTDSLKRQVVRRGAITALSAYGDDARPALPALTVLRATPGG
jgi:HEAT repeat protein